MSFESSSCGWEGTTPGGVLHSDPGELAKPASVCRQRRFALLRRAGFGPAPRRGVPIWSSCWPAPPQAGRPNLRRSLRMKVKDKEVLQPEAGS